MGLVLFAGAAGAQNVVSLPDANLTSTLTAIVREQAVVSVPSAITFVVDNVSIGTDASAAELRVTNIVTPSDTSTVRILARASAPTFAPPRPGAATWSASDVSWNGGAWINATPSTGHLTHDAFTTVATCDAGAANCGTGNLLFTLAPKAVVVSGQHQLTLIWKIESTDQ
jgi:hypothetical protein